MENQDELLCRGGAFADRLGEMGPEEKTQGIRQEEGDGKGGNNNMEGSEVKGTSLDSFAPG